MKVAVFLVCVVLVVRGWPVERHRVRRNDSTELAADGASGVKLAGAGTYKMNLDGNKVNFKVCHSSNCRGPLIFWYETSNAKTYSFHNVLSKPDKCPFAADFGTEPLVTMALGFTYQAFTDCASGSVANGGITFSGSNTYDACPLKAVDGVYTIEVESFPADCTVTITNARKIKEESESESLNPLVYIIPIVIGVVAILVAIGVVLYCCLCRKKKKKPVLAPAAAKSASSLPVSGDAQQAPSEAAAAPEQSSAAAPSSKMEEESSAKPEESQPVSSPPAEKKAKQTVPATPEKQKEKEKENEKEKAKEGEKPNGDAKTKADDKVKGAVGGKAVEPATSTVDDDFDGFNKPTGKKEPAGPTNWVNNGDFTSAKRMQESFDKQRVRGSAISKQSSRSKKSKQDSLDLMRTPFETAAESMVRHGMLDKLKDDAMNVSIVNDNNEPLKFTYMKKYYSENIRHDIDPREISLLVTSVHKILKLVNEFADEAKEILLRHEVVFVPDEVPLFTSASRAFLDKKSTPQFVRVFAFSTEFGHLIPTTTDDETLERRFANYSIQLLLVVAFRKEVGEVVRRKAIASMVRKLPKIVGIYSNEQIDKMPYPIYLLPEGLKANPNFLREIHLIRTEPGSTEDRSRQKKEAEKGEEEADKNKKRKTRSKSKGKSKSRSKSKRTITTC